MITRSLPNLMTFGWIFLFSGRFSWATPFCPYSSWRHQTETFLALLAIFAGNSPVPGEFPAQRQVTRSFNVFFDQRPNKQLSKQWWGWWFETPSSPLWRHWNVPNIFAELYSRSVHNDNTIAFSVQNCLCCLYWYRWWFGAEKAPRHHLNQWWSSKKTRTCISRHCKYCDVYRDHISYFEKWHRHIVI